MTRSCCPPCRLRFSRATAASLRSCPFCAGPIHLLPASAIVGFRLVAVEPLLADDPVVPASAALRVPPPAPGPWQQP